MKIFCKFVVNITMVVLESFNIQNNYLCIIDSQSIVWAFMNLQLFLYVLGPRISLIVNHSIISVNVSYDICLKIKEGVGKLSEKFFRLCFN